MLSLLLVHAGRPLSTDRLVDELWGEDPPPAARKTVQAHVAHLRKVLNRDAEVLAGVEGGYQLRIDDDALDVVQFEQAVARAREVREVEPSRAAELLDDALSLWRGLPMEGLADDSFALRVEAFRLEELRLSVIEERLELRIAGGESQQAAAELERLVALHPLRERLWALLALALYRDARQGAALGTFSRLRHVLGEELGIEPSPELRELEQRILDQDPTLTAIGAVATVPAGAVAPAERNPYKGLRSFEEADVADFFGREDLVRRLIERLDERGRRLVVLAGPSGSGKSSAVRAGMVSVLRSQGRAVVVIFPGNDPFAALAGAVSQLSDEAPAEVEARLEDGRPIAQGPVVLAVDQFEELFTMADPSVSERFLGLMAEGAPSEIWVVTVRADFLDRMLSHPRLGGQLEEALVLVPPLQDHEVVAAVVGPARRVGVEVEPALLNEIVRDVLARPTALPLLQYALTDCFERRRESTLTLADYREAGGISGALGRRADALYDSLSEEQREAVHRLLLSLITVTDDGSEVRRRITRTTLLSLPVGKTALQTVIERLGAQRLLTFDQDPDTGQATVEVAHEALISAWPRFAMWVEEARDDLRTRERLAMAAREWEESDRDPSFLLSGSRLVQISTWASTSSVDVTGLEGDYLEQSVAAEKARRRRTSRTRRLVVAGVATAVLGVTALGVVAFTQRQANAEQARIVRVGDLAAAANASLEIDPERSLLLAIEAVEATRRADGTVLTVAEEALHRAVLAQRMIGRVAHNGEGIAHFSPDGESFVTSAEDETTVQIWDVIAFEPLVTLRGHDADVIDAVFDRSGRRVATTSLDGTVRVWNAATGVTEIVLDGGDPAVPAFSNDGSMLAATSLVGGTRVWDLASENLLWQLSPPRGTDITLNLDFSPDDSLLAVTRTANDEATLLGPAIFDLGTGKLVRTLEGHDGDVSDIAFTPDGLHLVTSSFDATAKLWDLASGEEIGTYGGHQDGIQDLAVSAEGTTVASSGQGEVRVWDLATFQTLDEIVGHTGVVDGIDLSSDGDFLLTSSRIDRSTRLWDLNPHWSHELMGLPVEAGWAGAVDFSPDGTLLADIAPGLISGWDMSTGQEIYTFEGSAPMAISPDGALMAATGETDILLRDLRTGSVTRSIPHPEAVYDLAVSSRGMLASTGADQGVRIYSSPTSGTAQQFVIEDAFRATFDPTGEVLALSIRGADASGEDGDLELWNVDTHRHLATLHDQAGIIWSTAFDATGKYLATGGQDAIALVYDAATHELLHRLEGHTGPVTGVAFDPVRPELATVSADGSVRIWNVETGLQQLSLPFGSPIGDLAYSPDGRYLAVSGQGRTTVYILDVDELIAEAETRLTRWWTGRECRQYLQMDVCPVPPDSP